MTLHPQSPDADWLTALAHELRRHSLSPHLADQVVAEAATHLRDSGEPALRAFGPPADYASAVADSVGGPAGFGGPLAGFAGPPAGLVGPPGGLVGPPAGFGRPAGDPVGGIRLDVRGITKRFGRRRILNGVDLVVRAGQVAAVVGANGSGKSTFLRICAGLESPDRGEVRVHGALGFCPQEGGTSDFLYPDEHFVLIGAGRELPRQVSREAGRAHAAALDWSPPARGQTRHLSGGTRQKLNLTLAALGNPDVLLLDEPYQGFDRGSYLDFWQQVWRWRETGAAVVVVTHLLNQLDRVDVVLDLTPAGRAVA